MVCRGCVWAQAAASSIGIRKRLTQVFYGDKCERKEGEERGELREVSGEERGEARRERRGERGTARREEEGRRGVRGTARSEGGVRNGRSEGREELRGEGLRGGRGRGQLPCLWMLDCFSTNTPYGRISGSSSVLMRPLPDIFRSRGQRAAQSRQSALTESAQDSAYE